MHIFSWNVNGIRAAAGKNLIEKIENLSPEILCLQETKATEEQVKEVLEPLGGYHVFANSAEQKGYSGTALLSKQKPLQVKYGIGANEHDNEGRVISAEFEDFWVVSAYVPNSGQGLVRLDYRQTWDEAMLAFLKKLEETKPVVFCGDLNVAHQEIDIARPKANYNKTAGYTQPEIDGMTRFLENGFVDTFRHLHPTEVKYSWWSYRGGARQKNIGWRLDYLLISESLKNRLKDAVILNEIEGSDHCPVGVELK